MSVVNKIFIPTLISSVDYQPVRTLPHIYFYNGLKNCEPYYIEHYSGSTTNVTSSVLEKFPYVDNYDGLTPTTSSKSLLFFNETTPYGDTPTGSLYTEYWETYVSLLYNPKTRLINCSAIIPLADYFEMELNDIVQWRGNYYHLRAINQYNLKDGTCELQLLGPIIRDAAEPTIDCTFDFSSSFEYDIEYNVQFYMQAGGGGSTTNAAGGGGAGGFISGSYLVTTGSIYTVIVGAGGAGTLGQPGSNGSTSSFASNTAVSYSVLGGGGGGAGATGSAGNYNGQNGGSGGGSHRTGSRGSGSIGQGYNGGIGIGSGNASAGGGGGGPTAVGSNSFFFNANGVGGCGGAGINLFPGIQGAVGYRVGGGGGGGGYYAASVSVPGGLDPCPQLYVANGGAFCGIPCTSASRDNQGFDGIYPGGGAGGHGGNVYNVVGKNGAGGAILIRYPGSQRATGGQVVASGSYTYHYFTSSGNFSA